MPSSMAAVLLILRITATDSLKPNLNILGI